VIDSLRVFSFLADHPPQCPPQQIAIHAVKNEQHRRFFAPTLSSVAPGQTFKSDITYLHSGVAVVASAGQAPPRWGGAKIRRLQSD
jgi:hypothetical protein